MSTIAIQGFFPANVSGPDSSSSSSSCMTTLEFVGATSRVVIQLFAVNNEICDLCRYREREGVEVKWMGADC